jgi:two-component sensor histidine kinase
MGGCEGLSPHLYKKTGSSFISYEESLPFQGRDSWWLTTLTPLRDAQSRIYRLIGNAMNITDRKQAEEQLYASLQEKEVLLKEIHHRVKNNLQVVFSLLDLQSQQTQEQPILEMFRESQNRIRSMALIHEELYQANNLAKINFANYVHRLLTYLFQLYGVNPDIITLRLNIDTITFNIGTAIPCGLIINELVSNALKQFILVVGNDGIELQESTNLSRKKSLGWQLVKILVAQLEGQLSIEQNQGTVFKIRFSAQ